MQFAAVSCTNSGSQEWHWITSPITLVVVTPPLLPCLPLSPPSPTRRSQELHGGIRAGDGRCWWCGAWARTAAAGVVAGGVHHRRLLRRRRLRHPPLGRRRCWGTTWSRRRGTCL
uniref:Uncharacterized protein n=1 Tax=Oryza punctata TaxID=4537 RepID=A0A0E0KYI2_ORYPU